MQSVRSLDTWRTYPGTTSGLSRRHSRAASSNIAWLQDAWAFLTCLCRSTRSKVGARVFLRERYLLCVFSLKKFSPSCRQSSARTALPLRAADDKQAQLKLVSAAIEELLALWKNGTDPTLAEVLRCVAASKLLVIPESLQPNAYHYRALDTAEPFETADESDRQTDRAAAIDTFLSAPFSQIEPFATYLSGQAHFDTHQGVKGLEFDRVMVIMRVGRDSGFFRQT